MLLLDYWKPVVGFEGKYEVSITGQVRSVDRQVRCRAGKLRSSRGQLLAPQNHSRGYAQVGLCSRVHLVHALVARAFIGPVPEGKEVAHWDGSRTRNRLSNLRYATRAENVADKRRHGTSGAGETNAMAKLTDAQVAEIKRLRSQGINQYQLAELFAVRQQHVSRILSGQRRSRV
jgi:hypothetical protein